MSPFFSVIIPTFNRDKTILRAVKSVLSQSFKDYELIIVDDASTDSTQDLLKDLNCLVLKNEKNCGVSFSRNLGAKHAQGQYLAFLDSDDEWFSFKLQNQFDVIQKTNSKLVHTEEIWIRDGVRVNQMKKHQKGGGDQFERSCELCVICPSTVAIEKSCFFELGGFDETFTVCEDYDLWLKYTSLYECEFISEPQIKKFGGHTDQLSTMYVAMDYFRIKALDNILKIRELSTEKSAHAKKLLLSKSKNLIRGYKKHNNFENLSEIELIQARWLEA